MSELKLEVGKKYKSSSGDVFEIFTKHPNLNLLIGVNIITQSISTFNELGLNKQGNVLVSEYTEPEKLSGWINVYYTGVEYFANEEDADGMSKSERLAKIPLSQFNVGEGL